MEPKFEFAMAITLRLKKPRLELGPLPVGGRRLGVRIEGGSFEGPDLRGTVLPGGGEWPHVRDDDVFCFDARYHLRTDDGTTILLHNRGYRHATPAGHGAALGATARRHSRSGRILLPLHADLRGRAGPP